MKIQLRNSAGLGPPNSPYVFTTAEDAPPPPDPETIAFFQVTQTSFKLNWANPAPTEGIEFYTVGFSSNGGTRWSEEQTLESEIAYVKIRGEIKIKVRQ